MNLIDLTLNNPQPRDVRNALLPRFAEVDVHRRPCAVCGYEIVARDDNGRIRLRIPYFWAERLDSWIYFICKGEPA